MIKKHGFIALIVAISIDPDGKITKKVKKKVKNAESNTAAISEVATTVISNLVSDVIPNAIKKKRAKSGKGAQSDNGDTQAQAAG